MKRSLSIAGLAFTLLFGPWVSPGWTQADLRFEQHSPEVEKYWQKKIQRNPRDSRAYYHLGRHYEFTRRIQLAAEAYRQATLLDPGWPQAFFYQIGRAHV